MILFYHRSRLSLLMNRLAPFGFSTICHLGLITLAELNHSVLPELSICAQHIPPVTVRFDAPRFARSSSHAVAAFGNSDGRAPWSQRFLSSISLIIYAPTRENATRARNHHPEKPPALLDGKQYQASLVDPLHA
jgi:hypothetical protein